MLRKSKNFLIYFLVFSFVLLSQPWLVNKASAYTRPTLNLNIPSQPKIGDEMKIRVMAMYFDEKEPTKIGYSYYIKGFPGGGLVAGSQDRFVKDGVLGNQYGNLKYIDYEPTAGHKIRYWYRTTLDSTGTEKEPWENNDKDINKNKIHDDWERRYFRIDPTTEAVNPDDDPDGDSYNWLDRMKAAHRVCITFSMPEATHCALYGFPGEVCLHKALFDAGVPQTADVGPAGIINPTSPRYGIGTDNKFTNYEEYVFGTNPKLADTDGDSILDEADVIGMGQDECKFKVTPALGPVGRKFPVEIKTLGYVPRGSGEFHWWRGGSPGWGGIFDWSCLLLLSKTNTVEISPGPPLDIILQSEPEVPTPANNGTDYPEVKIEASVTGMEYKQRLYFKWYIGAKVIDEGYGKNIFTFPVTADPCSVVPVTCDVSEEFPGGVVRSGSASLDMGIGYDIPEDALSASLLYNTSQDQDEDGCIDGDMNCNFILDGGETWTTTDPFYDQINDDLLNNGRNIRQNDVITIHTEFSSTNGLCTLPDSDEPKDFVYVWYLDGKEQTDQSGAGDKPNPQIEGGTFQDFKFTVTKPPGSKHLVKLKLIRISDGFEYGQFGEKVFTVQTPTASIESGTAFGCDEEETGLCRVILEPDETRTVDFKAVLEYFQPTYAETFHYTWTFDGEVVKEKDTTEAEDILTYEFTHPGGVEEERTESHTVVITVDNYIDLDEIADESAINTYAVELVLKPGGAAVARGPLRTFFAQAGQAVSSHFKNIFNIVFTIGVIGFIVFVVMAAGQIKRKKE